MKKQLERARFEIWCANSLGYVIDLKRGIISILKDGMYDIYDKDEFITTISPFTLSYITIRLIEFSK